MRAGSPLLVYPMLLACGPETHSPIPSESDIQRLETKLARHPCIGKVDAWERNYRYKRNASVFWSDHQDFSVIEFHFRKAGTMTVAPARRILGPSDSLDWPDSAPIQSLSGVFNAKSGTTRVNKCTPVAPEH